jgi:hypothetical protein
VFMMNCDDVKHSFLYSRLPTTLYIMNILTINNLSANRPSGEQNVKTSSMPWNYPFLFSMRPSR